MMKKRWLIPIVGLILTAIFSYYAVVWKERDFIFLGQLVNGARFANLMSDFAGYSIGLVISIAVILWLIGRFKK